MHDRGNTESGIAIEAPPARRGDDVDTFYGVDVPDPYRWLEDPTSPETRAWVEGQNAHASAWLDTPRRTRIRERLQAAYDHPRVSPPVVKAGARWYLHNPGLQPHATLVRQLPGQEPTVVLDPNTLSDDGTRSLAQWTVSPDGTRVAYAVSDGGSDWMTWRVRDVATGQDLPDVVPQSKFDVADWLPDGSGFVYLWFPQEVGSVDANGRSEVRLHRLGTPASEDRCLATAGDAPASGVWQTLTDDGAWLILHFHRGGSHGHRIHAQRMDDGEPLGTPIVLTDHDDAKLLALGSRGNELFFLTDADAPNQRVVGIDVTKPEQWRTVVAERPKEPLAWAQISAGRLFCTHMRDAAHVVTMMDLDGNDLGPIECPPLSSTTGFSADADASEVFFSSRSWIRPATVYRFDLAQGEVSEFRRTTVPGIDLDDLHARQIFVPSPDGTQVPAVLMWKGDEGPRPTVLYGYGGFNISLSPEFSFAAATWLQLGGAYVVANLRGGGEYGETWHEAGTRLQKQNTFDDAIAVAEHLIDSGFTTRGQLAIHGRSNGGYLAGAVLVQRPDLFGAAVPTVGVLDLLRYHTFTIGWAWARDYGTVDDSEEMFRTLLRLSPVHNATPGDYPPTLIATGDHDDRVVPAHSYKFAAALQHAQQGTAPILLRVDTRAGHGAGKPIQMALDEIADMWTFLADALGLSETMP